MTSKHVIFVPAGHATHLALPLTLHDGQLDTVFCALSIEQMVSCLKKMRVHGRLVRTLILIFFLTQD